MVSRRLFVTRSAHVATVACLMGSSLLTFDANAVVLPTILECSACDTPPADEVTFCSEYAQYSACRIKGKSWAEMDKAAKEEYSKLLTNLPSSLSPSDCATTLHHLECAKVFNVCEMGSPQSFCHSSCVKTIVSNCSIAFQDTHERLEATQTMFCGSLQHPLVGIETSGGKCFTVDYEGPKHTAWIIGFTIAVVFSFLASVGINLQKKALKQNEFTAHELNQEPKPAYQLPLWVFGFILIVAGSILDFVAFGLAPQSLLAPLAALTLVWNMMLAPCFNKEKLSRKDIMATLIIFAGATIAVVFASHTSPSYNLSMLMQLYQDPLTIGYFVFVACCIAVHYALIQFVEKFSLTSRRHRLIQVGQPMVWSKVRLIGYAGLSGTMGGQSVLFAKSTAELLKAAFHGEDSFAHVQTYVIMLFLVSCLLCQIHFLNCGLLHYDALSVVPIYQAYWIISGVLGGVIYFQEIRAFTIQQAFMFVLGIMTTIFGVVLLSQRKPVAQTSMKRRYTIDRGTSGDSHGSSSKLDITSQSTVVTESVLDDTISIPRSVESMPTIIENEAELSTTEEDDEDENRLVEEEDREEAVSRHVIDNYLDMSATNAFTQILDGLGFQSGPQRIILSRRPSHRSFSHVGSSESRAPRRSVDDIEVGLPAATRESMPRERVPKRRSITFTSFQKKDPPPQ